MSSCVLVTGSAGFIGSHLTDRLLAKGFTVIGLDSLMLGRRENHKQALKNPDFTFIHEDLNNKVECFKKIQAAIQGRSLETVWHLAANSDIPKGMSDPSVDLTHTFMSTYHVLEVMKFLKVPNLVFASSSAIYGDRKDALSEESGPLFPISSYGAMKLASEGIITAALESYLKKVWIYRFPNVVGSRSTHGAIFDFVKKLRATPEILDVLGDGTQDKPYLHVSELIDAMAFAFEKSNDRLNFFNIGQESSSSTVKHMAELVVKQVSPKAKIRYAGGDRGWVGDVPAFKFSIEKIKRLGWSPKLTSNQALERAVREIAGES
jgi:UDP-glucose 4-epimerase